MYLNYKHMPALMLALNSPALLAGHVIKYFFFLRQGFGKDYLQGLSEGLRTLKKCRKVPFRQERLLNYVLIEWELVENCFVYASEFVKRHRRI